MFRFRSLSLLGAGLYHILESCQLKNELCYAYGTGTYAASRRVAGVLYPDTWQNQAPRPRTHLKTGISGAF